MKTCKERGCREDAKVKGMCRKHYSRAYYLKLKAGLLKPKK